ncbi:MAG: thioesterase family protein [Pseudomonadales bacterium]
MTNQPDLASALTQAPIICPDKQVLKEWIDYNGHMNMAYYHVVFDQTLDFAFDALGIGADYVTSDQCSMFSREVHVNYLAEASLGQRLKVTWQLLDWDRKRLHFFQHMRDASNETLLATSEQLAMHVDMNSRRTAPFPESIQQRIAAVGERHSALAAPSEAGRSIGIRR